MTSTRYREQLQSELHDIQTSLLELKRLIDQEKKILNDYRTRNKGKKSGVDKKMEKETQMRIGVMLEHISELVRKKEEIKRIERERL